MKKVAALVLTAGLLISAMPLTLLALTSNVRQKTQPANELSKDESFTDRTETLEFKFNPGNTAKITRLRVSVEVEAGQVHWTMADPGGAIKLRGAGTSGQASTDSGNLRAIDGTWVLRVQLDHASGKCHIRWTAN